ncbi:DUF6093 family protein [Bifidobacterium samirii]|uniref:Phage associated protein n=1 Tax=Bifidobacterium samirii TaxID=2306974 RepID=A0A430FUC1_9BIFI|nr:DUF6093 family protein [Bifidobacterium samirii]RSX56770.1 phage associated protein [Bifidobacterium samirii]
MTTMTPLTATLPELQALAESLMRDEFLITRPTGLSDTDPDTGVSTPRHETVYRGRGKLQTSGGIAGDQTGTSDRSGGIGGQVSEWTLYLHVPISATGLREHDLAECIRSRDPDLVGRRFRLVNMQSEKTYATARRWNVREIPNPWKDT